MARFSRRSIRGGLGHAGVVPGDVSPRPRGDREAARPSVRVVKRSERVVAPGSASGRSSRTGVDGAHRLTSMVRHVAETVRSRTTIGMRRSVIVS